MNERAVEGKTFSYVTIGFPTKLKHSVVYLIIAGQHIVDAAVLQLTMYERYAEAFSSVWVLSEFPKTTLKYIFKNTRSFFLSKEWRQVVGNSKSIT